MSDEPIWGSAPLVRMGEHCPSCGRFQFDDHPIEAISSDKVDEDFLDVVYEMVWEDDRGNVDWDRMWDGRGGLDGIDLFDDGRCWMLPGTFDDPVFEKIKRGIRKMRKEAAA